MQRGLAAHDVCSARWRQRDRDPRDSCRRTFALPAVPSPQVRPAIEATRSRGGSVPVHSRSIPTGQGIAAMRRADAALAASGHGHAWSWHSPACRMVVAYRTRPARRAAAASSSPMPFDRAAQPRDRTQRDPGVHPPRRKSAEALTSALSAPSHRHARTSGRSDSPPADEVAVRMRGEGSVPSEGGGPGHPRRAGREGRLAAGDRLVIALRRAGVELTRAADALVRIGDHLVPLRHPAGRAGEGEEDGEHRRREAERLQRDARVEVDVRIELLLDEVGIVESAIRSNSIATSSSGSS